MTQELPQQEQKIVADLSLEDSIESTDPEGMFDWALVLLFAGIVVVMVVSIFCRYVLNNSLSWADEAIRFAFVWFTFLGAAIVFRDNVAIRIDILLEIMPPGLRSFVERTNRWLMIAFYAFLLVAGMIWVFRTQGTQMSSMRLPLNWFFYFALPATSAVALYYAFFFKTPTGKT